MLRQMTPAELQRRLGDPNTVLIDIREPDEFAREHIVGARLAPLSTWDRHDFSREQGKAAVFLCRSGNRTTANAGRLQALGCAEAYQLAGGMDAWRKAGLPTVLDRRAPIDLMRQVQIAAGSLVVLGVLLGAVVSPWAYLLSGFVGAGLMTAGITGFCGMARLLQVMPWNRRAALPAA